MWLWVGFGVSAVYSVVMALLVFAYVRKKRLAAMAPEERAEILARQEKEQQDRKLRKAIRREARWLLKEIPHHLAIQHRFETYYTEGAPSKRARHTRGGKKKRQRVEFEAVLLTKTEIWFRFNGRKLPSGTSFYDLKNPNNHVLANLQYGIGRPVRFYEDNEFNLFLRVGLKNSLMGVPKKVLWRDVVQRLPESRPMAFAVGVNEYGKVIYQDITKWPHGLILGATGGGKSVGLKQLLITLFLRNNPNNLRVYLVDLKRTELPKFKHAPHVVEFMNRTEEVIPVLEELYAEMERRLSLFEEVCNDISGWNKINPHNRLPRILFVVDELARLTRSDYRSESIHYISELASIGRAAGIHLLMATQTVTKEVLPIDILANIEGRICYSVRNTTASVLAIGNAAAVGLQPPGRCVFVDGLLDMYLQTPYASHDDIEAALEKAQETEEEEEAPEPLQWLAMIALNNYGGRAAWRDLFDDYQNQAAPWKVPAHRVKSLLSAAEYEPGQEDPATVEHEGQRYILAPGQVLEPTQARRFLPINGRYPSQNELIEALQAARQPQEVIDEPETAGSAL